MRNTNAILCLSLSVLVSLSAQANTEQSFDVERFTRVAASQGVAVNVTMGSSTQVVARAETAKDLSVDGAIEGCDGWAGERRESA